MKVFKISLLLFLIFLFPFHSFAFDNTNGLATNDAHFLSIQEYCAFLIATTSTDDDQGLYDPETMDGEIARKILSDNQQPHFLYGIVHGIDPQLPMLGLTEFDAIKCCDWMEKFLLCNDHALSSTEVASSLLQDDASCEANQVSQLFLLHHEDGTFEISKVFKKKKSSAPLMMVENPEKKPAPFPRDVSENSRDNQRRNNYDEPHMGLSLSDLIYDDSNTDYDDSLIGHTDNNTTQHGNYIAITNYNFCGMPFPRFIKDYFMKKWERKATQIAYTKIAKELKQAMEKSPSHQEQFPAGVSRTLVPKANGVKINETLEKFHQSFDNYNLTRAKLKQFCEHNQIVVPRSRSSSLTNPSSFKLSTSDRGRSVYGTDDELEERAQNKDHLPSSHTKNELKNENHRTSVIDSLTTFFLMLQRSFYSFIG